jgi:serine/threonine protein kinase
LKAVAKEAHLVRLLEVFEDDDRLYLVLEYLPNGDLISYFRRRPLMSEDELRAFYVKVVLSVRNLHRHNVIHRDIKMDNILLDRNFEPVLGDFGISSVWDPKRPIKDTGGTPAYLPPEVIRAKGEVCLKSDVWSLGVLLFALTYGSVPFEGRDPQDLYHNILSSKFVQPEDNEVSPDLRDLIAGMICPSIPRRLSVEEVLEHPWFERCLQRTLVEKSETVLQQKRDEKIRKDKIIRELNDTGFEIDFICQSINASAFNHASACYANKVLWGSQPA